jgi:hypothetical protein
MKHARTKVMTAGAALWLSACEHSPHAVQQTERIDALTPTTLVATAEARRGQTVTLVGYFTWRTDTRALWENRDAHLDAQQERKGQGFDYWAKCVTIYPAGDVRRLSDRQVRVTGKVAVIGKNDMRSLWTCNAVALEGAVITPE